MVRRFRGLGAIDNIMCPAGEMWTGASCAPDSAAPTPLIPVGSPPVALPPPQICPSWGCGGFAPIGFPIPASNCPQGYAWDGASCVPAGELPPVQTPAGPVAVSIDPLTGQPVSSIPPNGPFPPGYGYQQVEAPGSPYPYVYIGGEQPNYIPPMATGILAAANDPSYPGWNLKTPPDGSYKASCTQITSDGAGNLYAVCEDVQGNPHQSSLFYGGCVTAPFNQNGQLGCGGQGGQQIFQRATGGSPLSPFTMSPFATAPLGTAAPWSVYQTYFPGETVSYAGATWTALAQSTGQAPGPGSRLWIMAGTIPSLYSTSPYTPTVQQQTLQVPGTRSIPAPPTILSSAGSFLSTYGWWIAGGLAAVIILPRILPAHR